LRSSSVWQRRYRSVS